VPAPRPEQKIKNLTHAEDRGDRPMTPQQASYLHSLCSELGEKPDESLTEAQAESLIHDLKARIGRAHRRG